MIARCVVLLGIAAGALFSGTLSQAAEITPQSVTAALPRLEGLITDAMARTGVPGVAVAVVVGTEVVYLKGFGLRKVGEDAKVDPDTIFQIASMSKPFTSTAIASVVGTPLSGGGTFDWDSRIADLDSGFRLADPWVTSQLTIRDLLSHRSGMPDHAGDLLEDLGYSREEILYRLRLLPPSSSLRSHYAYTNFLLTEAGVATANALDTTWRDLIRTRVFEPLGMSRTSARFGDFIAEPNRAALHMMDEGTATARYQRNPQAQAPAGGVTSSARDLAKWLQLQLNQGRFEGRQIVDAAALAETHRPQIISGTSHDSGRASFYGLGWNISYEPHGQASLSHSGAFFVGGRTIVSMLPDSNVGIVVLANAFPTGLPEAISRSFFDILIEGAPSRDWLPLFEGLFEAMAQVENDVDFSKAPPDPTAGLPASAYVGLYENAYFGPLEIARKAGGLTLKFGKGLDPFALTHFDRDVFQFECDGRGDHSGVMVGVSFKSEDGSRASAVTLDFFDENDNGTWSRQTGAEGNGG